MFFVNITPNKEKNIPLQNIVLTTVKEKQEHPDLVVYPGFVIDLEEHGFDENKTKRNREIQSHVKEGRALVLAELPEEVNMEDNRNQIDARQKQDTILEIQGTYAISLLEDKIEYEKDPDIRAAAINRLREIAGDDQYDNPELNQSNRNPMV